MMTKTKINEWLVRSVKQLVDLSEFPSLETQVVLAYVLNTTREWLITHPDVELTDAQTEQADFLLSRLCNEEPLPYLTGHQAFYGLDFLVTPDVLIPRPETELLVEECIEWLEARPSRRKVADIGTGSGVIAVCLADHFQDVNIYAVDVSEKALQVAGKNANLFHVNERIRFARSDLLENCQEQFDLIAANLPYIPTSTLKELPVARFEPLLALDGGKNGLDFISKLITQSPNNLKPGGMIILEIEANQSEVVQQLAKNSYPHAQITLLTDLANHPRILKIQV